VSTCYVYGLFRPTGEPFYIGKGSGKRLLDHERDFANPRKSRNPHKAYIIAAAKRAGLAIEKRKFVDGLQEKEAFELEKFLIQEIGREPKGPLVNLTDGGEGVVGLLFTPEHRAAISAKLKGKPKSPSHKLHCAKNASIGGQASAAISKELRQERYLKGLRSRPPEKRSEWQQKAWETRCINNPDEMERMTKFGKSQMSPERNKRAIAAAAARSPEQRSNDVRKANASRTPEERSANAKKSWETRRANLRSKT
jgi:hypothetical protein